MSKIYGKLVTIRDYVTIRVSNGNVRCPVTRIALSNDDIKTIVMSGTAPHIYAINPNDPHDFVLLTMKNYMKSTDELFGAKKEEPKKDTAETTKHSINREALESLLNKANEKKKEEEKPAVEEVKEPEKVEVVEEQPASEDKVEEVKTEEVVEDKTEDAVEEPAESEEEEKIDVDSLTGVVEQAKPADNYYKKNNKKHK